MTLTVQVFATLKERAGAPTLSLELAGPITVRELRARLGEQHPELAELFARALVAVNREFAFDHEAVQPTDEVALFPPVSGG